MKRFLILSCLAAILFSVRPSFAQTAPAGTLRVQDAWQQVYKDLPDLPLENQYVNRESGKVDASNTLVSRLIRYHYFIKGRPVGFRLDWKYTLADFLGINEPIQADSYPGSDTLRKNPFESDRTIIQTLNLKQRNALVQSLANVFTRRSQ